MVRHLSAIAVARFKTASKCVTSEIRPCGNESRAATLRGNHERDGDIPLSIVQCPQSRRVSLSRYGVISQITPYPSAPSLLAVPYRFPSASMTTLLSGKPPSLPPLKR